MRPDKQTAIKYRLSGLSYGEISKMLNIPKSTLSLWLRDLVLSKNAEAKVHATYKAGYTKGLLKKSALQTKKAQKASRSIRLRASQEIKPLTKRDLQILGIGLYWGEGYKKLKRVNGVQKTSHPLSLSNSDPILIKSYISFLLEVCGVSQQKIRLSIRMYHHQNQKQILQYWLKVTGLQATQFTKPYIGVSKSSQGKKPYNTLPYGTLRVDVYDTPLFHKVIGWLEGVQKQFS